MAETIKAGDIITFGEAFGFPPMRVLESITMAEALKYDGEKPRMELLPTAPMVGVAQVLTFGAKKYAAHNWRGGFDYSRLIGAAYRHLSSYNDGEDLDPESGLSHIDHALCTLMFLSEQIKKGTGNDDRYKPSE